MILTSINYQESIDFLIESINLNLNKEIVYQDNNLNSDKINMTFKLFEKEINKLYEKTRILQEVLHYSEEFLKDNIYQYSDECRTIVKSIETSRDSIMNPNYISHEISLVEGSGIYTDRNGAALTHTNNKNNSINLSETTSSIIPIKDITRDNINTPYYSNEKDLLNQIHYRSFYIFDKPQKQGLKETLTLLLSSPMTINYLDIKTSNCDIFAINFITENGSIETISPYHNNILVNKKVMKIQLVIDVNNYAKSLYYIDKERIDNNFWNKANTQLLNSLSQTNQSTNSSYITNNILTASGLLKYEEDFNKYKQAFKDWVQKKQDVLSQNETLLNIYNKEIDLYKQIRPDWHDEWDMDKSIFSMDDAPDIENKTEYNYNELTNSILNKYTNDSSEIDNVVFNVNNNRVILPYTGTTKKDTIASSYKSPNELARHQIYDMYNLNFTNFEE